MEWNWSIVDAIVVVVCCLLPAASAWRASVKVKDNEIPYKDQRYGNLLDAKDTERYENLLDAKDTKTFWTPKIRKPFGRKRYENLLDPIHSKTVLRNGGKKSG